MVAMKPEQMETGERYSIEYKCRDIGYGIEGGNDVYTFEGQTRDGKFALRPTNQGPEIYLFADEILDIEGNEAPSDVWAFAEEAPVYADAVSDLWHWSTNYDAGEGPFTLFLDMIGYSDEEFGMAIYGPTVRTSESRPGVSSWDANLGYVELDKLAKALSQYADRPGDVRAWVDQLLSFDAH